MLNAKKVTSIIATAALASTSLVALSGCGIIDKAKETFGKTEVGQKMDSSKVSSKEDYENYSAIQDANGNKYATVIQMTQKGEADFKVDDMKNKMSSIGVNWYQAIIGDSRGTGKEETCYLYFTGDATLSDLNKLCEMISDTYDAKVMTLEEYENYAKKAAQGGQLYYVESTYFGPAAGK